MDFVYNGKLRRGEREKAIKADLEGGNKVPLKDIIKSHSRSSVYSVLKNLEKKGEGRYVKVELNGKTVTAFQMIEKKAPYEEVEMLIQLLSEANPIEIKREASKDFMALASKYEIISDKAIDFLLDKWHQKLYCDVQKNLLSTILRITLKAKEKKYSEVIEKVKTAADKALEIAKNSSAEPELRQTAWELLIYLEEPKITDTAFELLTRQDEDETLMSYIREEVKRYADENRFDARKRLYDILLKSNRETQTYQRTLLLLQAIRYPESSKRVGRFAAEPEKSST
ncbi:MAG: hypothetical protein V1850_00185 [Candidatus Bathyarchaeota archaeon]